MEETTTARVLLMAEATLEGAISTQAVAAIAVQDHLTVVAIVVRDHLMVETITDLAHHIKEVVQDLQIRATLLTKAVTSTQAAAATMAILHTTAAIADLAHHIKEETCIPRTTMAAVTPEADTHTSQTTETTTIATITIETDGKVTSRWKGTRATVTGAATADIPQQMGQLTVHEIHMKETLEVDLHQSEGTILVADRRHQEGAALEADRHLAVQALEVNPHLCPAPAPKLLMLDFLLIILPAQTMAIRLSARLDAEIGATSSWNVNSVATTRISGDTENAVKNFYDVEFTQSL